MLRNLIVNKKFSINIGFTSLKYFFKKLALGTSLKSQFF